jgi:hypothetical protein
MQIALRALLQEVIQLVHEEKLSQTNSKSLMDSLSFPMRVVTIPLQSGNQLNKGNGTSVMGSPTTDYLSRLASS